MRPDNVNESIGFIKGYRPHSGEIIEQYLEKLESQLDTITKNLGGYEDSDPVSLSENIGIWNKGLEKRLEKAIKGLRQIYNFDKKGQNSYAQIFMIAEQILKEIGG